MKWGEYGRRPLVVLSLVAMIDAVDRGILPGVLSDVQDDLRFSDFQSGLLGTAYVLAGFFVVMPAGYLADRGKRTHIIALVLLSWGVISALNSLVQNLAQFIAIRAALGIGETIDNPASQSLLADYYSTERRGRAYAAQRAAPLVGTAIGTGVGGLVSATLGWRWAFLLVGVPGSVIAVLCWRLPEPTRKGSQGPATRGWRAAREDTRALVRVRTLRALMVGTAVGTGALTGIGFWAPEFYERHTSLTSSQASGVVGGLILVGALVGTLFGGWARDRIAQRVAGASMALTAVTQAVGAVALMIVFLDVPIAVRLIFSVIGVAFIVAGFPALSATTADVVPSRVRGLAFSITGFFSALTSALSPLVIGFIADRFDYVVDGEVQGNLANAFLIVTPLVFIGSAVLWRGRRHMTADLLRVEAA
ncbi:MAG TPA: MFS transporter [Acidimicrobiales bacterium]|nr:MFS transporter [Acidimicrobiales bacterium]